MIYQELPTLNLDTQQSCNDSCREHAADCVVAPDTSLDDALSKYRNSDGTYNYDAISDKLKSLGQNIRTAQNRLAELNRNPTNNQSEIAAVQKTILTNQREYTPLYDAVQKLQLYGNDKEKESAKNVFKSQPDGYGLLRMWWVKSPSALKFDADLAKRVGLIREEAIIRAGAIADRQQRENAERNALGEFVINGTLAFIPFVGNGVAGYEAYSGTDIFGNKLSTTQRLIAGTAAVLPFIGAFVKKVAPLLKLVRNGEAASNELEVSCLSRNWKNASAGLV